MSPTRREKKQSIIAHSEYNTKWDEFNKTYFNGKGSWTFGGTQKNPGYHVTLPNSEKRRKVRTLDLKEVVNDTVKERIFTSKKAARAFCQEIAQLGVNVHRAYIDIGPEAPVSLSDVDRILDDRVIAVPYWIDYGKDSQLAEDGQNSTKALKYYFCPNPDNWKPDASKGESENESTGISTVSLTQGQYGPEYNVTCMDEKIPPITFRLKSTHKWWSVWRMTNLPYNEYGVPSPSPTMHQLNVELGTKYCPV